MLAPTTVGAALLYYYGYVQSYSYFAYFGVQLNSLNISTQELASRSVAGLYLPVAILLTAGATTAWAYGSLIRITTKSDVSARTWRTLRIVGIVLIVVGLILFARGVLGVFRPSVSRTEPIGLTPSALGLGALLVACGRHIGALKTDRLVDRGQRVQDRAVWILTWGIVVLGLFWLANSMAAAYGTGQAQVTSGKIETLPAVIVDTKERLYTTTNGVSETALPQDADQAFRYRYRGFHVLASSDKRLLLIPIDWAHTTPKSVLLLPIDDAVRLHYVVAQP